MARDIFEKNAQDIERLPQVHANGSGDTQGRKFYVEVLNKSAIVLITAFWEAYCEDLIAEAQNAVVTQNFVSKTIPESLKKQVAEELKKEPHDLAIWKLADFGWKTVRHERLERYSEKPNRSLNSQNSANVIELFELTIGLTDMTVAWKWKQMNVANAKEKLDLYVEFRGAIAHRGQAADSGTTIHITDNFSDVRHLLAR